MAFQLFGVRAESIRWLLLMYFSLFVTAIYLMAVRVTSAEVAAAVTFLCACLSVPIYAEGMPSCTTCSLPHWARWRCCSISTRVAAAGCSGRLLRRLFAVDEDHGPVLPGRRTALHRVSRADPVRRRGAEIGGYSTFITAGLRGIRCTELRLSARRSAALSTACISRCR